jgi:hypothetical protein
VPLVFLATSADKGLNMTNDIILELSMLKIEANPKICVAMVDLFKKANILISLERSKLTQILPQTCPSSQFPSPPRVYPSSQYCYCRKILPILPQCDIYGPVQFVFVKPSARHGNLFDICDCKCAPYFGNRHLEKTLGKSWKRTNRCQKFMTFHFMKMDVVTCHRWLAVVPTNYLQSIPEYRPTYA